MRADAQNLEAIHRAIVQHNGNCGAPLVEIRMNPYEVERLDFEDFLGIPIKADDDLPTGRFKLVCSGQHGDAPAVETEAELVALYRAVASAEGFTLLGRAAHRCAEALERGRIE